MLTSQEYLDRAVKAFEGFSFIEADGYIADALKTKSEEGDVIPSEFYEIAFQIAVKRELKYKAMIWGMRYLIRENDEGKRLKMADNVYELIKQMVPSFFKFW